MATLNPLAPEFIPGQNPLPQQQDLISFDWFATYLPRSVPYFSPTQPHSLYYCSTATSPFPFSFCQPHHQLLAPEFPEQPNQRITVQLSHVEQPHNGALEVTVPLKDDSSSFPKQCRRFFRKTTDGGRRGSTCHAKDSRFQASVRMSKGKDVGGGQLIKKNGHRTSGEVLKHEGNIRCMDQLRTPKKHRPVMPLCSGGNHTTVMIRNIPNKYNREMLVEFLDYYCMMENQKEHEQDPEDHMVSAFDFLYLPIDFKTGLNKGYAFVNFTDSKAAWKFHLATNNQKWDLFNSYKIREVVTARVQGKEQLVRRFETMNFPCEREEVLPVRFSPPRDGTIKAVQKTMGRLIDAHGARKFVGEWQQSS